jgi:hypothetical protein
MLKFLSVCGLTILFVCSLFSVSPAVLNLQLLGILQGEHDGDLFGDAVAGLGDINGDGYEDFAVGARWYGNYRGKVYIYFGGPTLDTTADLTFEGKEFGDFVYMVRGMGDINKDGFADFAISSQRDPGPGYVYIYFGGETVDTIPDIILSGSLENKTVRRFGWEMASGDLNHDGEIDIAVGSDDIGHCSVFMGDVRADTTPDYILTKNNHYYSIMGIASGDVNGDHYDDLIVSSGQLTESYFYFGGESLHTEPDIIFPFCGPCTFGDLNGDGIEDLATPRGVYFGSTNFDTLLDLHIESYPGAVGHINKDRYGDLVVNAYDPGGMGLVYVYLGGTQMDTIPDWGVLGKYWGGLGSAIATADINNDGVDELIISEPQYFFGSNKGRVYVYSGDTSFVSVEEGEEEQKLPYEFTLEQNYPNPFNANTVIRYSLAISRPTLTTLKIYNILGEEVRELVNCMKASGNYKVIWDGKDKFGKEVASGIYLYQLKVGDQKKTKKLLLLK